MFTIIISALLLAFIAVSLSVYVFQEKLVFIPYKGLTASPSDINLLHEDVYLKSTQGNQIHGWFLPHPDPKACVLFLHGNAGNISHRLETLSFLHELQLSVLIIDYQGYGQSDGKPTEQASYDDALAAWNYLIHDKQLSSDEIILFGRSLGGAVASWLAKEKQPALLILESTFSSLADAGKDVYPFLPVSLLARIKYDSKEHIKQIKSPVHIAHSRGDEIIAYKHGEALFRLANEPKSFYELQGGHNDSFHLSKDGYRESLLDFINSNL